MTISNEQMEKLIEEYHIYIQKIINQVYCFIEPSVKDELYQVGLIGLWKGISAYHKKAPEDFDRKKFVNIICAYIRYEMAASFRISKTIRPSGKQWHNYIKIKQLLNTNPDASNEQLKNIITKAGLRYDWYLKAKCVMNPASLDMNIGDDANTETYHLIPYNDNNLNRHTEQSYIDYIIDSAMCGVKLNRDKELIRTWLNSVINGKELNFTELSKMYKLSSCTVGVIINRFIDVCRFVRDCEYEFFRNPNGTLCFPESAEKNKTHNGKKIPGVRWILRNRKWKVVINIGKKKSVYIGHFEKYEEAVRARRDAEIKYRGFSNIEI